MIATTHASTLVGLEAHPVQVEVDISRGLPAFDIAGLPEASVRESRMRVRSALEQVGFPLPSRRVTVNVAPADPRKHGAGFDLAEVGSGKEQSRDLALDQLDQCLSQLLWRSINVESELEKAFA